MWFIGVEVEQEASAPPPKKNPGSAPETAHTIKEKKRKNLLLRLLQTDIILLQREHKQYTTSIHGLFH